MRMVPVQSSNVARVGYDADERSLRVEFKSGAAYELSGVSAEAYAAFMSAESLGRHFGTHIKGHFPSAKIGGAESKPPQEKRTEPAPSTIAEDHHDADAALEAAARRFRGEQ